MPLQQLRLDGAGWNHLQSSLHLVQDSPGELVGASLATHVAGSRFAADPEVLVTRQNHIRA